MNRHYYSKSKNIVHWVLAPSEKQVCFTQHKRGVICMTYLKVKRVNCYESCRVQILKLPQWNFEKKIQHIFTCTTASDSLWNVLRDSILQSLAYTLFIINVVCNSKACGKWCMTVNQIKRRLSHQQEHPFTERWSGCGRANGQASWTKWDFII